MKRLMIVALAAMAAACASTAEPGEAGGSAWIQSWGASPLAPSVGGAFGGAPSFENQTIRQVVRLSAGGSELRVRFTNEFGAAPLKIGAASIALAGPDGAPTGRVIPLSFSGGRSATVASMAPLLSDPVDLDAAPLQSVSISIYFPETTGPCTCHFTAVATGYVSGPGDFTAAGTFEPTEEPLIQRAFISGVDVLADGPAKTIVAFGDSITDGVGATTDGDDRWPDVLADRLVARGGASFGVSNQAISGNRLLAGGVDANGGLAIFGDSILARMDRDVLAVPGVEYVILFIGVNDIGNGTGPASGGDGGPFALPQAETNEQTMIAAYRQVIARAHAHGVKVYGATIAPYGGAGYWNEDGEALRQAVNTWIRDGGEFDGVVDFDAAVRDPADPTKMADGLHMGDFLHGSPAGYAAMGNAIDLALFE